MATNYIQRGNIVTIPASASFEPGAVVVAGNLIGVAQGYAASGEPVDVELVGVYSLPKAFVGGGIAVGAAVYFDPAEKLSKTDSESGANPLLGYAVEAAAEGAATVKVRLKG
jgi:predicted RecA/RadA family phage recombinase